MSEKRCFVYCGGDRCTCACRPVAFRIQGLGCPERPECDDRRYCGECGKFGSTNPDTDNCADCDLRISRTPSEQERGL